jgi:CheY-like chemotaxis protein
MAVSVTADLPLVQNTNALASLCPGVEWMVDDVVAVVTDLYFQSRISAAARLAERSVRFVSAATALDSVNAYRLVLVDLDAGIDPLAAVRRLRDIDSGPIVAFGPHVNTDLRKAAREAGADRVLAKSKFVTELPKLMAGRR